MLTQSAGLTQSQKYIKKIIGVIGVLPKLLQHISNCQKAAAFQSQCNRLEDRSRFFLLLFLSFYET